MTRDEALLIFGLESDADQAMIKTVYRRRMRAIHPDVGPAGDRVWRTAEAARLSSAHTILTTQTVAGAPAPVRPSRAPFSAPAARPAPATDPTRKTSRPASTGSSSAAFAERHSPLSGGPLAGIGSLFNFATRDTIGRWVALAIALGLSLLVEGPSSHGLIMLLLAGSLLTLQAGLGARGPSSPSGLLVGALRLGLSATGVVLFGIVGLVEGKAAAAGARRVA